MTTSKQVRLLIFRVPSTPLYQLLYIICFPVLLRGLTVKSQLFINSSIIIFSCANRSKRAENNNSAISMTYLHENIHDDPYRTALMVFFEWSWHRATFIEKLAKLSDHIV